MAQWSLVLIALLLERVPSQKPTIRRYHKAFGLSTRVLADLLLRMATEFLVYPTEVSINKLPILLFLNYILHMIYYIYFVTYSLFLH